MDWHIWLRAKVSAMVHFLTTFRPNKRDADMDMRYSWFVVVDDDTYIKVCLFIYWTTPLIVFFYQYYFLHIMFNIKN